MRHERRCTAASNATLAELKVDASKLGLGFSIPTSFAGRVPTGTRDQPDNALFFWAFETAPGSLTRTDRDAPWMVWLNGGCGDCAPRCYTP